MNKLIIITGGSASGKTHLASRLAKYLGDRAIYLSQDNFYKPGGDSTRNYDVPEAFDFKKQDDIISQLINNEEVDLPIYDFSKHDTDGTKKMKPAEFIIFEGLFTFFDKELSNKADFKIFVDTPADTRLSRRLIRDTQERKRSIEEIIKRWLKDVQPSYNNYISQMKKRADVVIPWEQMNERSMKSVIVTVTHLDRSIIDVVKE